MKRLFCTTRHCPSHGPTLTCIPDYSCRTPSAAYVAHLPTRWLPTCLRIPSEYNNCGATGATWHVRGGCIAFTGSESAGDVEEIRLDDDDVATVVKFAVALWTERSKDDNDEGLNDRQACTSRLTAFFR